MARLVVLLSVLLAQGCSLVVDTRCSDERTYCPGGTRCVDGRCEPAGADADSDADGDADADLDADLDAETEPDADAEIDASCATCHDDIECTDDLCDALGCRFVAHSGRCPASTECVDYECRLGEGCVGIAADRDDDGFCDAECPDGEPGVIRDCVDGDCDDENDAVNPRHVELCETEADDNCDGDPNPRVGERVGTELILAGADPAADSRMASLVWTGAVYGLAWAEAVEGQQQIFFARLSDTGREIGEIAQVSDTVGANARPSLVVAGDHFGVAWTDDSSGHNEILFTTINGAGHPAEPAIEVSSEDEFDSQEPSLAYDAVNDEFGVAWEDEHAGFTQVYFARVDPMRRTRIGDGVPITDGSRRSMEPSLVWADTLYGLAWADSRGEFSIEIWFKQFANEATPASDVQITEEDGHGSVQPSLAWNGRSFGLAWADDRSTPSEVYFADVPFGGAARRGSPVSLEDSSASLSPSLTWSDGLYGVAWEDGLGQGRDIFFALVAESSAMVGEVEQLSFADQSRWPSIAVTQADVAIVWDQDSGTTKIHFVRSGHCAEE